MWNRLIKLSVYFLVFLMPIFWLPFSYEAFDFAKSYLLFFLVLVGIIAWLGKMIFQDREIKFRKNSLDIFVLVFLGIISLGYLFSVDKVSSLLGSHGRFWPSLMGVLSLGGFYFLLTNNVEKKPQSQGLKKEEGNRIKIKKLIDLFLCSSSLVILSSYLSLFKVWPWINAKLETIGLSLPEVMSNRIFNPIGNSIEELSIFLVFILVLAVGLISSEKNKKKLVLYGLLILAILGILMIIDFWLTWLMLALSSFLFLIVGFWKRIFKDKVSRLTLVIFLLFFSTIFLFVNPLAEIMRNNQSFEEIKSLPRKSLFSQEIGWQVGLEAVKEKPILGSGIGNYYYSFNKHKSVDFIETDLWRRRFDRGASHISEILATYGIVGFLSFGLMVAMFFIQSFSLRKKSKEKESSNEENMAGKDWFLVLPLSVSAAALLTAHFFYYQNAVLAFSFWLIMGLGVVSWQSCQEKKISFKDFPEMGLFFNVLFWLILIGFILASFGLTKYYLADVYYRDYLQNPADNLEQLEKASQIAPKRSTYHLVLARAYLNEFVKEKNSSQPDNQVMIETIASAVEEGKAAVDLSPNSVAAKETLGVIYRDIRDMVKGSLDYGIKNFEEAIRLEPNNPILLTELGKLKLEKGDKEEAKRLFEEALQLKPNYPYAGLELSLINEVEGEMEKAIERLESLAKIYPYEEILFHLGRVYYNSEQTDKAIAQFQEALKIAPNYTNAHYSLGLAYQRIGNKEEALKELREALRLSPGEESIMRKIEEIESGEENIEGEIEQGEIEEREED